MQPDLFAVPQAKPLCGTCRFWKAAPHMQCPVPGLLPGYCSVDYPHALTACNVTGVGGSCERHKPRSPASSDTR